MNRRKSEQGRGDFSNNPFKSLKSFKPGHDTPSPKKTKLSARKETKEDDPDLFLRAVSGVRPLRGEDEAAQRAAPGRDAPVRHVEEEDQALFLRAMQKIGTRLAPEPEPDDDENSPRQSASSRMKQLKRGTIRISEELDLHGHTRDEALRMLESFVRAAYGRGDRAVLVITGKGINSPEGPVLQGAVSDWLRTKGKGMVAETGPAPRDRGGSGAVVVFIRNKMKG